MCVTKDRLQTKVEPHLKTKGATVQKKVVYTFIASFFTLALTACSETTTKDRNLSATISYYAEQKYPEYEYAFIDLNNDGVDDAVVLLQGHSWCGSDGCMLLILRGEGEGYRVVSKSAATTEKIRVAASVTQGWRDLIVHSDEAEKLLQFDGMGYPPNPPAQPTATQEQLDAAEIVLP